jgi:hypothetical protein
MLDRSPRRSVSTFRDFVGGDSVNMVVRAICPSPFISSAALRQRKKTDPQHGLCSCKSWPRRHEADGGQEELDGRWVSLPSGSSRRRRNLQLQSIRSCPRIGFRRTRTQSAAVDGTQCNGTRTRWLFELLRCRSLIEAVRGNLRTNRSDCYTRSVRVRVRVPRC